ncbi:ABC-type methionine transport system permease subunit [Oxalobacteraceae bacterium GrIS 1.11]
MLTLNLMAAFIVLVCGLLALNRMCPRTALGIRATWLLLTVGAAAILLLGAPPAWPEVALHWSIAALACLDRRN